MNPSDKSEFALTVGAAMEVYQQPLSKTALNVWWEVLKDFSLDAIKQALTLHLRDPQSGRFPPKPADVIAKIPTGHPGADEAWSMVAHALGDEQETLVLTQPMRVAFFVADDLADDKIAARMAFLDVYRREIAKAGPAVWEVILGHDATRRDDVLQSAIKAGRLGVDRVAALLSHKTDKVSAPVLKLVSGGK